jgi:hypothetical protein
MASITDSIKKLIKKIFGSSTQQNIPGIPKQQANRPPLNTLQQYLDKYYPIHRPQMGPDLGISSRVSISIYLRGKTGNHVYAGVFDKEFQYSASLLKVAAMFAAFKLRKKARDLIDDIKAGNVVIGSQPAFFTALEGRLNLASALPKLTSVAGNFQKPSYTQVLKIGGNFNQPSTLSADFTNSPGTGFVHHMEQMIIPSDNCSAGECIIRLSFAYINVVLMEDGFFDKTTVNNSSPQGIWLAGDYIQAFCTNNFSKKQTYVTLPTTNDCDNANFCGSAQNTTSLEMARFFYQILLRKLVDPQSSQEMFDLLQRAQMGNDNSFLSRLTTMSLLFDVNAVKIGQGPLKPGSQRAVGIPKLEVRSEGIIIKWHIPDQTSQQKWDDLNLTGEAAICWQNINNKPDTDQHIEGMANLINDTISKFVKQDPLIP